MRTGYARSAVLSSPINWRKHIEMAPLFEFHSNYVCDLELPDPTRGYTVRTPGIGTVLSRCHGQSTSYKASTPPELSPRRCSPNPVSSSSMRTFCHAGLCPPFDPSKNGPNFGKPIGTRLRPVKNG